MYKAFELKTDEDVFQMLQCRCSFQLNTIIELYVMFTRSTEEILSFNSKHLILILKLHPNFTNNYLLRWTFERCFDHKD